MTDGWDDERLAAAFRARFDRPAPHGLVAAITAAVLDRRPAQRFPSGRRWVGLAAAGLVVLIVVGASIGRIGLRPSSSAAPSAAGPPERTAPTSVFGLPVGTVSDALAMRDGGVDDRELAVAGWYTPAGPIGCPAPPTPRVSPVQVWCPDDFESLTEEPQALIVVTDTTTTYRAPVGPVLNPDLDDIDGSWVPVPPMVGTPGESTPVHVVMLGHFDDRRSDLCPRAEVDPCRDRFVVDRVHWVDGIALPTSVQNELDGMLPRSTPADIEAVVRAEAAESPVLSMATVDGATGLARIEPALGTGRRGLIDRAALWVVRVLEGDRITTYVVVDGTNAIYEMTEDGDAIPVGGSLTPSASPTAPSAPASPATWPPKGSVLNTLSSQVEPGRPPAQVAIVDRSGRLEGVQETGTIDPATQPFDGRFGAYPEPGTPGLVHLAWTGGLCDSQITVTVSADLGSITFDMGPQPDCDSIGIGRQLVLDFSGTVDVPAIELLDAAVTPTPGARTYELDCGPLGPDTCERRAEAIVAENATGSPAKRVESITFTDECGSHTLVFDDGTGMAASIDCIAPSPN